MMAHTASCGSEGQKMEEDADKEDTEHHNGEGDAAGLQSLKRDLLHTNVCPSNSSVSMNHTALCDLTSNTVLTGGHENESQSNTDVAENLSAKTRTESDSRVAVPDSDSVHSVEVPDSDSVHSVDVPDSDGVDSVEVPDSDGVNSVDDRDMDTSELNKVSDSLMTDTDNHLSPEKDEVLRLDTEIEMAQPIQLRSRAIFIDTVTNSSGNISLSGSKRNTTDDDNSPQPKRPTPERVENEAAEKNETVPLPEPASEDLPDLSSDSDDDSDDSDVAASRRKRLRRQMLRRPRLDRQSISSDDSDSTLDDDNDDDAYKKTDTDDDKTESDEVRLSLEAAFGKPNPKPNWFSVPELRKREYGYRSGCFMEKVQGSLSMVKRLVRVERMKAHEGCVNALSFNRIGTLLASGSDDLNIVLWNWQRARPSLIYDSGHRSNVFQAKFMPYSGDCHVISCARDGQVRLAELSLTGVCKATRKLAQHKGAVHKLALELDSPNVFLSCGEDALTYLFDLRQEKPHKLVITKENEKKVPLYSIHSNPCDPRQFCVGGRDHYVRVYDKRKINEDIDGGVLKKFCPDHLIDSEIKANITCASYNYNGTEILATYNDEDIYLFDNTMSDGANYIHRYIGHRNNATAKNVNFYGPKSEFIVSGSDCGYIYFWDKETEAIINFQEGDDAGVVNVLEPHPTLPFLATSGLDHDVKLWMPYEPDPELCMDELRKTVKKNFTDRCQERKYSEPEMIGGQMLWFIMHHFRNSARRRMREEGQALSSSDDDNSSRSDDSDTNSMQCAQS